MKILLYQIDDSIHIEIPNEVQSNELSEQLIQIQELEYAKQKKINVLFNETEWIDYLVLIHLFLLFYKLKKMGKLLTFDINYEQEAIENIRFIKFMDDYGFLSMIKMLQDADLTYDFSNYKKLHAYNQLYNGNFEASECLFPFHVINNENVKDDLIDEVLDRIQRVLSPNYSEKEIENISFNTSIFLQETINNVFEHAFDNPEEAFCGIMVRYIHKDFGSSTMNRTRYYIHLQGNKQASLPFRNGYFDISKRLQVESESMNPYNDKMGVKILDNCIQIFISDIGKGILESMNETDPQNERKWILNTFEIGKRGKKSQKKKNTKFGGLHMIYELMHGNDNYLGVKGEYNWVCIACAKGNKKRSELKYVHKDGIMVENVFKGFTVVGNIDCTIRNTAGNLMRIPKNIINNIYINNTILDSLDISEEIAVIDFRNRVNEIDVDIIKDKKVVLCFAGFNTDKSVWSKQIYSISENFNIVDTLIIADIPRIEVDKYNIVFEGMKINFKKVVLLSDGYEVAVLSNNNGRVTNDKKATIEYINSTNKSVGDSAESLIQEIRRYDSLLFWKHLSRSHKDFFINDEIEWTNNGNVSMAGYLDFSQASFDNDLQKILLWQLFRIPSEKHANYFISIDRFIEDLCEKINDKICALNKKNNLSSVRIGSVYVTGLSGRIAGNKTDGENVIEYYYFYHPLGNSKDEKIRTLLLWPDKELVNVLFPDEVNTHHYKRVANTPFISEGGNKFFTTQQYDDKNNSIKLRQDELYEQLQIEPVWAKRLIRIGHFDLIDHHDLIYVNAITMFSKHMLESFSENSYNSKSSFDYLFKEMYIALGRSNTNEYIHNDINEKYIDMAINKMDGTNIPEDEGLFVYLTDYETVQIVYEMKKVFSEQFHKRIIPITPINRHRGSSALLISPILMDNIKNKIEELRVANKKEQVRVTVFFATATSTRLQRECKHILYRLHANEIKCVALIDRQHFPLGSRESNSYSSFCKIDLPYLASGYRCKLCIGLEYLESLSKKMWVEELSSRCIEIMEIWKCIKVSDGVRDIGITGKTITLPSKLKDRIEKISKEYKINTVPIVTDIGLVLFAIEYATITASIEFLYYCEEVDGIEDNVVIMLIATYLLVLGDYEMSRIDRQSQVEKLYEILKRQNNHNEYTALAVLCLMSQKKDIKKKLHKIYIKKYKKEHFQNIDFIIATLGMLSAVDFSEQDPTLRYWLNVDKEDYSDILYGIFLLTDGEQETRHKTLLSRMGDSLQNFTKLDFLSAQNDVKFLKMAYEKLQNSYLYDYNQYEEIKEELLKSLNIMDGLLENIIRGGIINKNQLTQCRNDLYHNANLFNQCIFHKYYNSKTARDEVDKWMLSAIDEVRNSTAYRNVNCYYEGITSKLSDGSCRYYYYPEVLHREIKYLISDMRYCDIDNPIEENGEKYNGKIKVIFEQDYLCFAFGNYIRKEFSLATLIERKKLKYNRPSIMMMRILFKKKTEELFVFKMNTDNNMYWAEIHIPYLIP